MLNPKILTVEKPLKVKVDKIEGGRVKLILTDRQVFEVNRKFFGASLKKGDVLYLNFLSEGQLAISKDEVAKEVLKEILGEKKEGD